MWDRHRSELRLQLSAPIWGAVQSALAVEASPEPVGARASACTKPRTTWKSALQPNRTRCCNGAFQNLPLKSPPQRPGVAELRCDAQFSARSGLAIQTRLPSLNLVFRALTSAAMSRWFAGSGSTLKRPKVLLTFYRQTQAHFHSSTKNRPTWKSAFKLLLVLSQRRKGAE